MSIEPKNQESLPIDVRELVDRCMGNIELAERVLGKLYERFDVDMLELEKALSAKDGKLIASIAHRLKGAASNVAAHELHQCAVTIEELARTDHLEDLPTHLETLKNQWSRINHSAMSSALSSYTA